MLRALFRRVFPARSGDDFPAGYIHHRFFVDRVDGGPILLVGDFTGRDFHVLKKKFSDTYLLDIIDNRIAEPPFFLLQSITDAIPFPDHFFRYVIVGEVIEHIWEDRQALLEIRRVLQTDGTFLLTIPFFSDVPHFHYHIYSPRSLTILLEHSGFTVSSLRYRGLVVSLPNEVAAFLALLTFPIFKARTLSKVNTLFLRLHNLLSDNYWINRPFDLFGGFVVLKRSSVFVDPIELQRKEWDIPVSASTP